MISYTTRLQLQKPDADEFQLIGVLNSNEDMIDRAVGARMVAAGVIPPVNELYDGLIVNERDTGKTWIASSNPAGGFDRAWIRFPWYMLSNSALAILASQDMHVQNQIFINGSNSSAADIVGGKIVIPISGIYRFDVYGQFGPSTHSSQGKRSCHNLINNVEHSFIYDTLPSNPDNTSEQFTFNVPPLMLKAGDTFVPQIYQNSTVSISNCRATVASTLISVTGRNNN